MEKCFNFKSEMKLRLGLILWFSDKTYISSCSSDVPSQLQIMMDAMYD